jgi:hypothetical protein
LGDHDAPRYAPSLALGIDQHRPSPGTGGRDHPFDVRQPTLAVIGEHHDVVAREARLELGELVGQHLVRRCGLEVDAQQLLLSTDNAQLDGGRDRRIAVQAGADTLRPDEALERVPGIVLADYRQQAHGRAERCRVPRHVCRAAGSLLGALDPHHRHRRLRRDAAHVAEPVAVQHHVAHDQHPRAREIGERTAAGARLSRCALCSSGHLRPIGKYSNPAPRTSSGS